MKETQPLLHSISETAKLTGLGRTTLYELINAGDLTSIKIGSRRLIKRQSIDELINRHSAEAA